MTTNTQTTRINAVSFANHLVNDWKQQFDSHPDYDFNFEIKDKQLMFNSEELCHVDDIDMTNSTVGLEYISFALSTGNRAIIKIYWLYDETVETIIEISSSDPANHHIS